jgi:hypothetical protein
MDGGLLCVGWDHGCLETGDSRRNHRHETTAGGGSGIGLCLLTYATMAGL